jgi:hypothetical protein
VGLDGLHVALEVGEVGLERVSERQVEKQAGEDEKKRRVRRTHLLVERALLETEGVNDVVDLACPRLKGLLSLLGRGVGT